MSASSAKAMPELIKEVSDSFARGVSPAIPDPFIPDPQPSGHDALQSLLAFASLREQLRQQRAREAAGEGRAASTRVVEQLVLDEVLQVVAERALAITGADGVAIALADGDHIVCRGSAGSIAPDRGAQLNLNSSFSGACFRTAQVVRCDDSESDPRVDIHACRRLGTRSMVAVPLSGRRNVIGLLEAFSIEAFGFNDSDVRSLTLLGELILAAIRPEEEERLQATAEQLAVAVEAPPKIVDESLAEAAAEIESSTPPQAELEPEIMFPEEAEPVREPATSTGARPGLAVVFVVVVIAALFGAGLWWKIHRDSSASSVAPQVPAAAVAPPTEKAHTALPMEASAIDLGSASAVEEKLSVLPKVTGIRHWSATGSSTVVIDLQDQVQYEAHRLAAPDRIYFDLHDTALTPSLTNRTIEVGDSLLVRVRVAQPMPGVTRVVLETAGDSNFSISLEPNPYRLVAELRAIGAKPQSKAQFDLFRSPSDAGKTTLTAKTSSEDARLRAHVPKFRIVVDAGHGGWDLGTVGRKGLLEKDLVLDVAQRLGYMLSDRLNAEVVYTRQDDSYVPLEDRAGIANQAQADLFVSVHANYSDSASARGVETYYTNTFSSVNARSRSANSVGLQDVNWANVDIREKVHESRRFAASVQRSLYAMLAQKNPAIRDRGVKEAAYVVLTGTSMPAVLAEISFVSSPSDESNLLSANYRQQIANALYKGIAGYVATTPRVKLASASAKPTGR